MEDWSASNSFFEILNGVILDWLGWTTGISILHLQDKMEGGIG
jgi:hypothetical protein